LSIKNRIKKINRSFFAPIFLATWVLFFLYVISSISFIERTGNIVNDTFTYRLQYTQNRHNDEIVIIKIDDRTLDTLGKSDLWMIAFDKWVYGEFIEKIFTDYKAEVLGIDIVFANPSVLGEEDEKKLAQVFEKYKKQVVIATRGDYNPYPLCLYSTVQQGAIDTIEQDRIRIFRSTPFIYDLQAKCPNAQIYAWNDTTISTLSREVLDIYKERIDPFAKQEIEENLAVFDANDSGVAHVDYYSNGKRNNGTFGYESYSFIDIYQGLKETADGTPIDLEWKIILLGEVWTLIHDKHFTPVHQNVEMPWVEINANIITTMREGRDLRDASVMLSFFIFFLFQIGVIISVLSLRTVWAFIVLFLCVSVLFVFWWWMFVLGYIYNIFLWILGCIFSFMFAYIYRFQVTDKAKRMMKKQFSSYVSPDVVDEISRDPDSILVQGEKRELSILFSDIVSFTSISENTDPELLVKILNEYFSEMTKIIYDNKGTLDKYIGDAVMCFFNAPLRQENHSYFTCKTALEQQKRLKELNEVWQKKWYPEIKIRIGIHTGEAVHGNIGSSDTRVNYTVIGDSVNLASRLEGVCKEYKVSVCVSQEVYELQKDAFYFRELDVISVKGRQKPVKIYQLIALKDHPLSEKIQTYLERYLEALRAYQQENFETAQALFLTNIGDATSEMMWNRCKNIREWKAELTQGVFEMHTK
jgi:class 3 adenylate cyclase/CHASE2 domain-containing sensor protein